MDISDILLIGFFSIVYLIAMIYVVVIVRASNKKILIHKGNYDPDEPRGVITWGEINNMNPPNHVNCRSKLIIKDDEFEYYAYKQEEVLNEFKDMLDDN